MSEKQRIISLFPLTPEEQAALLQKRAAAASTREHTDVQNITAVQTAAEFNNVKVYEAPTRSDAHGGKKSAKRIATVVAIICAMLVGGGITVSLMSAKNAPAAGVSAVSGQNETSVLQSESSLPLKAAEKTVPSAQHDCYYYEDGVLTIKSDAYFESDYKEYMNLSNLKKVKIESGVTAIGAKAFDGCGNLSEISIPDTVTRIGESAFEDCTSLTGITLSESLQIIDGWAFAGCTGLKTVHIPKNVSWIGDLAFSKCSALEAVSVDKDNQYFSAEGGVLFDKDKTVLYKYPPARSDTSYVIPDSVRYIDAHSFCVCNNLSGVTIPDGVLSVGDRAFASCKNLASVNIPSSMRYIGVWAFSGCSKIGSISVPYEVTDIDHSAFFKWTDSQKIIITGRKAAPDTWHKNWNASCNASIIWEG